MTEKRKPGRVGIVSAVIDPLLFAGGKRVFQIADAVVAHFGNKYDKKQIVNNIRSRITFLTTRKGYKFEKNSLRQVQLVNMLDASTLELKSISVVNEHGDLVKTELDRSDVPVTESK